MMRRGSFILSLCLLVLLSGVVALNLAPDTRLPNFRGAPMHRVLGLVLFFLAGVAGLLGMFMMTSACRRLAGNVRQMKSAGPLGRLDSPHPDLTPLVDAVNGVAAHAERVIAEAEVRVRELELRLKIATAERQHAEAIIYSISDAVLVTDPFDDIVLANDAAAKTLDFDLGQAARAPVERMLKDARIVSLIREMRQSVEGSPAGSSGSRRIVEHKVKEPDGEKTYKVTLSCVSAPGQESAGVVAVLHDMTREKEVAEMKNDFVSNVSHELRTPLASIRAYVEMLIDGEASDDKTRREFYDVIHNEANRLGRLIDNILNISRIESGLVKVNKRPQSLTMILKEAIEVIVPQARQKQIALNETISPAVYQTLADRDMLYEAVLNLLSNAIKYTPEGGTVSVDTAVDEARKKVIARISDTGVGIPQKDLPYIFDKFFRVEANNRMAKGTGLGLSLVRHIIETVHHGRLFVESTVGKGSTFGFELDLEQ